MAADQSSFVRDGYVGPLPLLTAGECRTLLAHLRRKRPAPPVWPKGLAATDRLLSRLAADRRLTDLLVPLLGDDIILWGCLLVERQAGRAHPWHVDAESASADGRFVTAWIGLENTGSSSSLRFVCGSHKCRTIQQVRAERNVPRGDLPTETVLDWARGDNPDARLAEPEAHDGDVILFDGRMWHGSHNRLADQTRSALLLQYAVADMPVRVTDGREWPFKVCETARPPVILVHGTAVGSANALVRPPAPAPAPQLAALRSSLCSIRLPLAEGAGGWRRYPLFKGRTPAVDSMSCHAAVLSRGHSPHPPHVHADEELLIVLDGEADLLVADAPVYEGARPIHVTAGDFAYYPAGQHHTIRNSGTAPVTYMMFRWRTQGAAPAGNRMQPTLFRAPAAAEAKAGRGFTIRPVVSAPTRWLRKLHCHTSRIEPGAGYAAHVDPYDVAILMRSGRVATLGREVGPGGLIYYRAGSMHGMRNIGDEPAHYLVFEFHGRPLAAAATEVGQAAQAALAPVS